jgi:hypothetical protein
MTPCPSGRTLIDDMTSGDWGGLAYDAREKFACIDNTGAFRFEWAIGTYAPMVIAGLVSKYAGKYVNPTLRRLPFIGNKVKL